MNQSELFSTYNKAKKAAKSGKLSAPRTNRALGILQSKNVDERLSKYNTTLTSCECPDFRKTQKACKHMIAKMIIEKASSEHAQQKTSKTLVIRFWAASNDPAGMIEGKYTQSSIEEAMYSEVEVFESKSGSFRPARQNYNEIFSWINENDFSISRTQLIKKSSSGKYHALYEIELRKELAA